MKTWKKEALKKAIEDKIDIEDEGHEIVQLTDWHWRIDDHIDVWPSSKKYRFGKMGAVKQYDNSIKEIFINLETE